MKDEAVYRNKFKLCGVDVEVVSFDPVNEHGTAVISLFTQDRDGAWRCCCLTAEDVRKIYAALPQPNPGAHAAVC